MIRHCYTKIAEGNLHLDFKLRYIKFDLSGLLIDPIVTRHRQTFFLRSEDSD